MRVSYKSTCAIIKKVGDVKVAREMCILIASSLKPLSELVGLCEDQLPHSKALSDRLKNEVGHQVTRELRDALDNFSIDGDSIYDRAVYNIALGIQCLAHDGVKGFLKDEDGNFFIDEDKWRDES